jgi:hypothetical protein
VLPRTFSWCLLRIAYPADKWKEKLDFRRFKPVKCLPRSADEESAMRNEDSATRRADQRKAISQVDVLNVKDLNKGDVYFSRATVVDVSNTGILLLVERENILSVPLRSSLSLNGLINVSVGFTIEVMDTYIEGIVTRTRPEGGGDFMIAVDFREDAPEYWRNCLVDLLPEDGDGNGI